MHGAASRGHTDVVQTLIAWGATVNEKDKRRSVFRRIFKSKRLFFMTEIFFFSQKKVDRFCISHLLMATRARASCCVRRTASIRTRSTSMARLRWTWPSIVHKSIVCALCSNSTLTRARRASRRGRKSKSYSCWTNITTDQ